MPSCNQELHISAKKENPYTLTLRCVQGEGHEGQHEWHIWTSDYNEVTQKDGVIKVIH